MSDFNCVMPYWIDTPGYSDRDRAMFVAGAEFQAIYQLLVNDGWRGTVLIHRENESRIRMMCARLKCDCEIKHHKDYEGCETWADAVIDDRPQQEPPR